MIVPQYMKTIHKSVLSIQLAGLLLISTLGLISCSGGSGSSASSAGGIIATGRAQVSGNVVSSTLAGGLDNIQVALDNERTETNAKGEFTFLDVASGAKTIVFSKSGRSAKLNVNLVSASRHDINNIRISNGGVSVETIKTNKQEGEKTHEDDADEKHDDDSDDGKRHDDDGHDDDDDKDSHDDDDEHDDDKDGHDDDDEHDDDKDEHDDDDDDKEECKESSSKCDKD